MNSRKNHGKMFFIKEEGNILLIFAGSMILIMFFIGLALDLSMIYMHQNSLQDFLQIIREDRFANQDSIRFSDNPALTTYNIAYDVAEKNGFTGILKVYFLEDEPEHNYRSYKIRVELADESPFYFGKIFGLNKINLRARLDGGESYGEGFADVVWHSPIHVDNYNGSYSGKIGGFPTYVYDNNDLPSDW